jgi:hypothetical protein
MGKLGDILGDDFEEEYENKRREVEEQRRKVSQETMMEICFEAVEGGGFDGEEPRFTFDAGEVDHDVVLMESPQNDLHKFRHEFEQSGGVSLGMFHMGDLWSCVFNEDMVAMVDKIEEDEYYVVVGRYQENIQDAGTEDEEKYINISPVRGIVPLEVAKEYAEKYDSAMSGSDKQSQAEQQNKDEESSDDEDDVDVGDLGGDGGDGGDGGEVDSDKVIKVFHTIGDEAPQVLKETAAGDNDAISKLVKVTNKNLDGDADKERILDIFEDEVEEIEGRGEDEEEEDDDLDLDGLGDEDEDEDDDGDGEEDESEDAEEDDTTESSDESDDEDEDEGVDDWF